MIRCTPRDLRGHYWRGAVAYGDVVSGDTSEMGQEESLKEEEEGASAHPQYRGGENCNKEVTRADLRQMLIALDHTVFIAYTSQAPPNLFAITVARRGAASLCRSIAERWH